MTTDPLAGWIEQYAIETGRSDEWLAERLARAAGEMRRTGTYTQTYDEIAVGARVAWRNSARCIGRLYWRSLVVLDRRDAVTAEHMARACVDHLRFSTNGGRIRPALTVFPAGDANGVRPRNWDEEVIP